MNTSERITAEGSLFTDFYQLTMAQLYYHHGLHQTPAQFDYFFRRYPNYGQHAAGYCVNAGLAWLLDWMSETRFRDEDLAFLRTQRGQTGKRLFNDGFLTWLRTNGRFDGMTLLAIPEGRVVHPNVPLAVIQGPFAIAQLLESSLLNHLNYQTLVATKASRLREAARGGTVLEFGMRRAHDKGANAGVRAALIGGADFSSNTGISSVLGYPPKGTHAHSMVQAFIALGEGELGAFRAYADLYPDDCLLLVDIVDTLSSGVPNAITIFEELCRKGHEPLGIRLDSGDLAHLSVQTAKLLDNAGFPDTKIVLSNKLDELVIWQILTQIQHEAPRLGLDPDRLIGRLVYGVGTRLITSHGDAALGGVYKLVAVARGGAWLPAIKLSETPSKTLNPGDKRVWRLYDRRGMATADLVGLTEEEPKGRASLVLHHPTERETSRTLHQDELSDIEPLLVEVLREGTRVYDLPPVEEMRQRRQADVARLDPGVRRLVNPHLYHVSLTRRLWEEKQALITSLKGARGGNHGGLE